MKEKLHLIKDYVKDVDTDLKYDIRNSRISSLVILATISIALGSVFF